ncbi:MAG: hypothetical protein JWL59_3309 [Chthoniobacteraceae bacterium]|nr:hypothetical protein [Chthoniobacteraceae bacterium]
MRFLPGLHLTMMMVIFCVTARSQTLEPLPDDGRSARAALFKEVAALFASKDYEALDRLEESLRTSKEQFPEGTRKLPVFFDALSAPPANSEGKISREERVQFLAQLDAWIAARPQSAPAKIARTNALFSASNYYLNTAQLSGEANLWSSYLNLARQQLSDKDPALRQDPEFFRARLNLALLWGPKPPEFDKYHERALALDPEYLEYYLVKAQWLQRQPQSQSWEQYAEEAAHATADRFGMEVYARIVWALKAQAGFNVFDQTRASWPMVKQGFLDLEKRAPGSLWNLNAFCWYACAARDRETAAELFERLNDRWSKKMWVTQAFFESQKKWAQSTTDTDDGSEPIGRRVRDLFARGDFDGLEKMVARLRTDKRRSVTGNWLLPSFYAELAVPRMRGPTAQEWAAHLAQLEEWQKKQPDSATPRVALGHAWIKYAWAARGTGYVNTVTDEGWKLMAERLLKARAAVESARELPNKDADWFSAMQGVALGADWTREEYEQLFEEAIRFEPGYTPFYTSKAYYLLPRWHGQPGEWEQFASEASERAKQPELYARILLANVPYFAEDPFGSGGLSWPKLSAGFEAILATYPDRWNLLNYCWMACKAKQREAARELFAKVGEPAPSRPWKSRANFEAWKAWANGGVEPK